MINLQILCLISNPHCCPFSTLELPPQWPSNLPPHSNTPWLYLSPSIDPPPTSTPHRPSTSIPHNNCHLNPSPPPSANYIKFPSPITLSESKSKAPSNHLQSSLLEKVKPDDTSKCHSKGFRKAGWADKIKHFSFNLKFLFTLFQQVIYNPSKPMNKNDSTSSNGWTIQFNSWSNFQKFLFLHTQPNPY